MGLIAANMSQWTVKCYFMINIMRHTTLYWTNAPYISRRYVILLYAAINTNVGLIMAHIHLARELTYNFVCGLTEKLRLCQYVANIIEDNPTYCQGQYNRQLTFNAPWARRITFPIMLAMHWFNSDVFFGLHREL